MTMPADKVLEALRASLKESERLRQRNRQLTAASSEHRTEPTGPRIIGRSIRGKEAKEAKEVTGRPFSAR